MPGLSRLAILSAIGCGSGGTEEGGVEHEGVAHQAAVEDNSNLLVRLVEGPSNVRVRCDARVRGVGVTSVSYQATLRLIYPDGSIVQRNATVDQTAPAVVDNTDGAFKVTLAEQGAGSGQYIVVASFERLTDESTQNHRCEAIIEAVDDISGTATRLLGGVGDVQSGMTELPDPYLTATSHRQSGSHLICQSRLNHVSPNGTYDVSVTTANSVGLDVQNVSVSSGNPVTVIPTTNGGTAIVEWGTAASSVPSIVARYDYMGAPAVTSCDVSISDPASGGLLVLHELSRMDPSGCMDPAEPNDDCSAPYLGGTTSSRDFQGRLTTEGDTDYLFFSLQEGFPDPFQCGFPSFFCGKIELVDATPGQVFDIFAGQPGCTSGIATATGVTSWYLYWDSICAQDDSRSFVVTVRGSASCEPYTLRVARGLNVCPP